jgi:type I restriction enzyme S subunit
LNDGLVTDAANHITLEGLENSTARWVEEGSVLLAMYGSIGKLGIAGRRLTTNQAIAFTNPAPNEAKYLYYFLMYSRHDLASLGKGATQKNISQAVIKAYPFPLAPLPEQRRIVSAIETQLGRLDAAVARLHAAKAKLKRYKQAVLKAAYDEVAEIHEVKTFGELKEFSMYGPRFSSDDYTADGVPVLRTSDIDDRGHVNMSTAPKLSLSKEQIAKYKLKLGDLLVTRTGSIGTVSVFNDSVDAIAGAFLIQYRLGGVDPWYAFHFLRGPVAQHHLIGNIAGIGRPNLNVAAIDSLELPVPPMKEQVSIRKTLEVKLNRIAELDATLDAQLLQATRLRQAVLKRAFEGRLV